MINYLLGRTFLSPPIDNGGVSVTTVARCTVKVAAVSGALVVLLAWATASMASNLSFMKDTPYAHFTEQDHKMFKGALDAALNQAADGETRAWSNPASGAGGNIETIKTFKRGGASCRAVSIANKAKGRSASAEYNFCKQASGKWRLAN